METELGCAQQRQLDQIIEECLELVCERTRLDETQQRVVREQLNHLASKLPKPQLAKKAWKQPRWQPVALRQSHVPLVLYSRMCRVVEKHFKAPQKYPLVLYMRDMSERDQRDYFLNYHPETKCGALIVLQKLYVLEIEARGQYAESLPVLPCVRADGIGYVERWGDVNSLPPLAYTQICEVVVSPSRERYNQ